MELVNNLVEGVLIYVFRRTVVSGASSVGPFLEAVSRIILEIKNWKLEVSPRHCTPTFLRGRGAQIV